MRKNARLMRLCFICWMALAAGGGACSRQATDLPKLLPATPIAAELPAAGALTLAEVQGRIDAAPTPPGTSAAAFAQLKAELKRLLAARDADKFAAAPPAQDYNAVTDLLLAGSASEGWHLSWTYRNVGDYNQDGLVGISDLTPIGQYFGASAGSSAWQAGRLADGDGNGEINIADITPIGSNFFSYCTAYNVYGSDTAQGPWTLVGSLPLPAALPGSPLTLMYALPGLDYALYHVQPVDATGATGEPSWLAAAPGEAAEVSLGASHPLVTQTLGADGGQLDGPAATPLQGLSVRFAPGALPDGTSVELGYNDGSLTPADGVFRGPIIELATGSVENFTCPAEISLAFTPAAGYLPVPYDIDYAGRLHALEISALDPAGGSITFYSYHASEKALIDAKTDFADITAIGAYACEFTPDKDGFQIENRGSTYAPDGECFGMSAFAQWYWNMQHSSRGGLYPQFMYNVDGLSGQDLVATRAHLSISRQFDCSYRELAVERICNLTHAQNFGLLRGALLETKAPVLACLATPGLQQSHSVLLLGYRPWQPYSDEPPLPVILLSLYDPNWPGQISSMYYGRPAGVQEWSAARFTPYRRFGMPEFTTIVPEGDGSLVVNEPYADILADADAQFNSSRNATITLAAPLPDSILYTRQAVLNGTIESGEVLIEYLAATVNGEGTFSCEVAPTGDFSCAIPLFMGPNRINLITGGTDANEEAVIVPNNMPQGFNLTGGYEGCAIVVELRMDRQLDAERCLDLWVIDPSGEFCHWFWHDPTTDGGEMTTGLITETLQYTQTWTLQYSDTVRWGAPYRVRACWQMNCQGGPSIDTADYEVIVHGSEGLPTQFNQCFSGTIAETYPDLSQPDPFGSGPWWSDVCTIVPLPTGEGAASAVTPAAKGDSGAPLLYLHLPLPPAAPGR